MTRSTCPPPPPTSQPRSKQPLTLSHGPMPPAPRRASFDTSSQRREESGIININAVIERARRSEAGLKPVAPVIHPHRPSQLALPPPVRPSQRARYLSLTLVMMLIIAGLSAVLITHLSPASTPPESAPDEAPEVVTEDVQPAQRASVSIKPLNSSLVSVKTAANNVVHAAHQGLASALVKDTPPTALQPSPEAPETTPPPPKVTAKPKRTPTTPTRVARTPRTTSPPIATTHKTDRSLSRAQVTGVIRRNFGKLRACSKLSTRTGKLVMSFKINTDGRTAQVKPLTQGFRGAMVTRCFNKAIRGMRFPSHGNDHLIVKYPFSVGPK